ncbi:MAG: hypothetical protein Q4C50_01475 [Eubacteriales bacterium]|nr:hypothetical protein [Eubacteriales bacterium]
MSKVEKLRAEIERERKMLDEMLETMTMEEVLGQSRKLDRLIEDYIEATN